MNLRLPSCEFFSIFVKKIMGKEIMRLFNNHSITVNNRICIFVEG